MDISNSQLNMNPSKLVDWTPCRTYSHEAKISVPRKRDVRIIYIVDILPSKAESRIRNILL